MHFTSQTVLTVREDARGSSKTEKSYDLLIFSFCTRASNGGNRDAVALELVDDDVFVAVSLRVSLTVCQARHHASPLSRASM